MRKIRTSVYNVILLVLVAGLSSCMSYHYSNRHEGEQTGMTILNFEEPIELEDIVARNNPDAVSRGFASTDLLIQGTSLAIEGVKHLIDESQKKYHAEYKGGLSNVKFYDNNSQVGMLDPEGISFKGFTFQRTVKDEQTDREVAVFAKFSIDESKLEDVYFNSKFYLKIDSLWIDYAKVKVNDSRWFMPWTWFYKKEKVFHLDFNIDIHTNWIDELGGIHSNVPFGHFVLPVHNIPLNPDPMAKKAYFDSFRGRSISGSSYVIPRSVTFCSDPRGRISKCYGRGDFSITAQVTESSKTDFVSKLIMDNSDQLSQLKADELLKSIEKKLR
ncbi:MAG: hypothetical protein H6606_02420 [Flavobacteriales bacterium]|nr:hypothetical protein [Flavobacteriales bacterium]